MLVKRTRWIIHSTSHICLICMQHHKTLKVGLSHFALVACSRFRSALQWLRYILLGPAWLVGCKTWKYYIFKNFEFCKYQILEKKKKFWKIVLILRKQMFSFKICHFCKRYVWTLFYRWATKHKMKKIGETFIFFSYFQTFYAQPNITIIANV